MMSVGGRVAALAGASIGSLWLLHCSHHQQDKLASPTMQRFPWTLKAAEEQQRLPRVYFIIRQHGVELGGPGQSMGLVEMELREDIVPKTCKNFIALCTGSPGYGYYHTTFHRIIPNFMIQGGDLDNLKGTANYSSFPGGRYFKDENFTLKHDRPGLLSMANKGAHTNGSQFFITTAPAPWLDGKHVVFGEVVRGMEVIHKIEAQGVKSGSVKHIRYPPIIVDCGLVVQEQEEDKVEVKVDESKSCDSCAKDYAAVSG